MIAQATLTSKLDNYFNIAAFDERDLRRFFPAGYESTLRRYATASYLDGGWNGLLLDNTAQIDRVYLIVFPSPQVLDTIIAREVERGAPGALIFSHHMFDLAESGPGLEFAPEPVLEELREHHINLYVCHSPLDCHAQISTSGALATALKLKNQERFAPYHGGQAGVIGTVSVAGNSGATIGFHEFCKKVAEANELPSLRYHGIRHNGRPVSKVAVVAGGGGTVEYISEAVERGADTFVTGEWWLYGPGEYRATQREALHHYLKTADINLISATHYASEAVVMRLQMLDWFREHVAAVDPVFIPQEDPYR